MDSFGKKCASLKKGESYIKSQIQGKHPDNIRLYLERTFTETGYGSMSALQFCVFHNKPGLLKDLFDKGASISNIQGGTGLNPFFSAIVKGYTEVVTILLNNGFEINTKGNGNNTPLHLAVKRVIIQKWLVLCSRAE